MIRTGVFTVAEFARIPLRQPLPPLRCVPGSDATSAARRLGASDGLPSPVIRVTHRGVDGTVER
jgi:hypothetical protein